MVKLLRNGLNICKIKFSHDDHEIQYKKLLNIRKAISDNPLYGDTAIMLDTKGPEIRTSLLKNSQKLNLKAGDKLMISSDQNLVGKVDKISITYKNLTKSVQEGSRILVADGNLCLRVSKVF